MQHFDAIIIGSGQGGTPLARKLAQAGWNTALVEKRWAGGTCINDGCTPTKTMVASARVAYEAANSDRWGVRVDGYATNLEAVVERKNKIVSGFRAGNEKRLQGERQTLFYGEASFTGRKTLHVALNNGGSELITAEHIFIDTGSWPRIPDIPGLSNIPWFTSTTLLDLTTLPSHLLILGGSYIALEFGQMFRRFGSEVTIIERAPQLLSREDDDVTTAIRKMLEGEGIGIFTGAEAQQVEQTSRHIVLTIGTGGQTHTVEGSHLLVATGRAPQTAALRLEQTGVKTDAHGYIIVNDRLETSEPGIYALGDVKGGPAFTHIAYHDHLIVYKNLIEKANITTAERQVPYCMFTDPQLGRIGLSEKEATQQGLRYQVASLPMNNVARAIETGNTEGFMKVLIAPGSGKILGAAIFGAEGGELMSLLQMAMLGGITAQQMKEMVFAHPLYAEALNNLFLSLDK
ncbi:mercuric reductase [uncultured Chitinophaga sp.]|jgi:Pyruvate/2-oxoglutarate dehydrogenase complex, dihydrolipoamide dehydrogenase (E3) component, and related enzymes|uniref:mercuric reductase n=1 Tax=uncultured Chitinophaga sp. TaxID=339340 RepID=UPI0026255BDE|nr:mercuric reductase [uncultured Chitinophaga sp.]